MKFTLTYPDGDTMSYDSSKPSPWSGGKPLNQKARLDLEKQFGDIRQLVDEMIKRFKVKVTVIERDPPLPKGAVS